MKRQQDAFYIEDLNSQNKAFLDATTDGWWCKDYVLNKVCISDKLKKLLGFRDNEIASSNKGLQQL